MSAGQIWGLLRETFNEWSKNNAPRLGAALSYYTAFSLAPLLVLTLAIAGLIFGTEAARGRLTDEIGNTVGTQVGHAVAKMMPHDEPPGSGIFATVFGIIMLLFGASGVFGELQDSLNTIWEVKPKPGRGLWGIIQDRFLSFTMVLGTCFLLLVSLILSTILAAIAGLWTPEALPGSTYFWQVLNNLVAFGVITLLFALLFKYLPDAKVAWGDVWIGAVVTALLFTVGKFLLGLYLGRSSVTSAYGAAGSLVLILLWVYYSAMILLFGAGFTRMYALHYGSGFAPAENAEPATEEARRQQGLTADRRARPQGTPAGNSGGA